MPSFINSSKAALSSSTLSVLTACGDCEKSVETRKKMIEGLFPDCFEEIHVIGLRECKKDYLEKLKPDLFVEDNVNHAQKSIELDIPTVLIETPYNKGHDIPYVESYSDTWCDIASFVTCAKHLGCELKHSNVKDAMHSIFCKLRNIG